MIRPEYHRALSAFDRFHEVLWTDVDLDRVQSLDSYLERFPEIADEVRAEYEAAQRIRESGDSAPASIEDRFETEGTVHRGGMGVVRIAHDRILGRRVAIKTLHDLHGLIDPTMKERFRREARILSGLKHAGICKIFDILIEDDRAHVVMEYVEGGSLYERIRHARAYRAPGRAPAALPTGPGTADSHATELPCSPSHADEQDLRPTLRLVESIARAIDYSHGKGVVHRDIKPENVLLRPDGTPVVIDFGLAIDLTAPDSRLTDAHEILGSLPYMAPEQLEDGSQLDERTDVYALGVLLFELLTLEPPFRAETREAQIRAILAARPVSVRKLAPLVSRDLEAVCQKAMSGAPADRYATAGELADDLRNVRKLVPTVARPVGWLGRSLRTARRHRRTVVLLSVIALVVAGLTWTEVRDRSERAVRIGVVRKVAAGESLDPDEFEVWRSLVPDPEVRAEFERSPTEPGVWADIVTTMRRRPDRGPERLVRPGTTITEASPVLVFEVPRTDVQLTYELRVSGKGMADHRLTAVQPPGAKGSLEVPLDIRLEPGRYVWSAELAADHEESLRELFRPEPLEFDVVLPSTVAAIRAGVQRTGLPDLDRWLVARELLREDLAGEALETLGGRGAIGASDDLRRSVQRADALYRLGDWKGFDKVVSTVKSP